MKRTRRTFNSEFKAKVAIDAIREEKTVSELAQLYQIHPTLIGLWKREFLSNSSRVFEGNKDEKEEINRLKNENNNLVHQIGELTVDINWLKKKLQ